MGDSYKDWIEEARGWPAASDRWSGDQVEQFIADLRLLAQRKRDEQVRLSDALTNLIERIATECTAGLRHAGWTIRRQSSGPAGAMFADTASVMTKLIALLEELRRIERISAEPLGIMFDAMLRRVDELRPHVEAARAVMREMPDVFTEATAAVEIADVDAAESDERPMVEELPVTEAPPVGATTPPVLVARPAVEEPPLIVAEPPSLVAALEWTVEPEPPLPPSPVAAEPQSEPEPDPLERVLQWVDPMLTHLHADIVQVEEAESPLVRPDLQVEQTADLAAALWQQIRRGDLAGAYWIARAVEHGAEEAPISAKTLAAMQAIDWLWDYPQTLSDRCFDLMEKTEASSQPAQLAILASAIRMALFAPALVNGEHSVFARVLHARPPVAELEPIMAAARVYAQGYVPFEKQYAISVAGSQEKAATIARIREKMVQWLGTAAVTSLKGTVTNEVYHLWQQPGGRLYESARPILEDNVAAVAEVQKQAERWSRKIEDWFNDDLREHSTFTTRVFSDARVKLLAKGDEFSRLLRDWCNAVNVGTVAAMVPPGVPLLIDVVRDQSGNLTALLERLHKSDRTEAEVAAAVHLHRQLSEIYSTLFIDFPASPPRAVAENWYQDKNEPLDAMLLHRLELLPRLAIDETTEIEERLPTIGLALAASASSVAPAEAIAEWLQDEDFRWIDRYLEALGPVAIGADLRDVVARRRDECVQRLQAEIKTAIDEVERAAITTSLSNADADLLREELDNIVPPEVLLFPTVFAAVTHIRARCRRAVAERAAELAERWRTLCGTLRANIPAITRLSEDVRATLEKLDIRAAETLVQEISNVVDRPGGAKEEVLNALAFARRAGNTTFDAFVKLEPSISGWLEDNVDIWAISSGNKRHLPYRLREGGAFAGSLLAPPYQDRRDEAAEAVDAWGKLRDLPFDQTGSLREVLDRVTMMFRFLGFTYDRHDGAPLPKHDHLFLTVKMSAGRHAPIPAWGSEAYGTYQVVVMRGIKSFQRIRDCVASLPRHKEPLLLLYPGHMTPALRRELAAYTRAQQDPILALDDVLMLFLATSIDHRLKMFFEASLPFSAANPYTAQRDGPVAPEMFRGHQEAVDALMDRNGTCFICGGRQLGKSALQNHIQREFNLRTPNRHVWYVPIRDIFKSRDRQSVVALWTLLQDRFDDAGLLAGISRKHAIAAQFRQAFVQQPALEVTVFLDEADDLLEAMFHDRNKLWNELTALMDQTARRLKIVFAGNFHISRFAALRNQSATIHGKPIEIGPMEFAAASALIVEPAGTLGFRFREDRAVLHILSLTHRHASLLQLFMHDLLAEKMTSRDEGPPYWIETADVEKIYERLRQHMADRVELTLRLDPEYRALAYGMLLDQESSRDFRVTYSTSELRQLAQGLWAEGFENLKNTDVEARLDEMRTLGIVVRSGERFRLSGPHVVELFGNAAGIREGVEDLAHEKPRGKFEESGVHGWIGSTAARYSPLTLVQERLLQTSQTSVRLLFLSRAGGLDDVVAAFETLIKSAGNGQTRDYVIPAESFGARETVIWLRSFRKRQAPGSHAILLQIVPDETSEDDLLKHISDVQSYSRNVEDPRKTFQLVLVLPPRAGWTWLQIDTEQRARFEETALESSPWDEFGIRVRLEDIGKMQTGQAVQSVHETTSGWHLLLQALFDLWPKKDDGPSAACAALDAALAAGSALARDFVDGLGLTAPNAAGTFGDLVVLGRLPKSEVIDFCGDPLFQFLQRYALLTTRGAGGANVMVEPMAARLWTALTTA